jgi:hypothetical protein
VYSFIIYKSQNLLFKLVTGEKGFEPLTFGFGDHYSTIETILLNYISIFHLIKKKIIIPKY